MLGNTFSDLSKSVIIKLLKSNIAEGLFSVMTENKLKG